MIPVTHLQVPVHHTHLMAVKHRLQDLLDAMTACKHQGGRGGGCMLVLVALQSSAKAKGVGRGSWGRVGGGVEGRRGTEGTERALLFWFQLTHRYGPSQDNETERPIGVHLQVGMSIF